MKVGRSAQRTNRRKNTEKSHTKDDKEKEEGKKR
jgi:hypothetical protein